jgi:hypothetical protein
MPAVFESIRSSTDKAKSYAGDNPVLVLGGVAAAASACYLVAKYCTLTTTDAGRKGSLGLSLGKEKNGASAWQNFAGAFSKGHKQAEGGQGAGELQDKSKAASITNDFYSFVTDIYEWGWGASFHFAPKLWSHDWKAGEAAQEVRIAHMLRAAPGMKVLDVGCGVGGPMRIIAASSGAHITGITISEYQVERCKKLNAKVHHLRVSVTLHPLALAHNHQGTNQHISLSLDILLPLMFMLLQSVAWIRTSTLPCNTISQTRDASDARCWHMNVHIQKQPFCFAGWAGRLDGSRSRRLPRHAVCGQQLRRGILCRSYLSRRSGTFQCICIPSSWT